MEDILILMLTFLIVIIFMKLWKLVIFPKIIDKTTEIVEKNPKWITPKVRSKYYGLYDVDITTARSSIGALPRFRLPPIKGGKEKDNTRLELLIPEDTSVNDIDIIAKIALRGKIGILYGLVTPDKPAHWLSILLYMLDGGDIKEEAISWEDKK